MDGARTACLVVLGFLTSCAGTDGTHAAASPSIQAIATRLAADEYEGRKTGTAGYRRSAEFVAELFAGAGLEPGVDGGWFQTVPLLSRTIVADESGGVVRGRGEELQLRYLENVLVYADRERPRTGFDGEVVFVGHGTHAPELGHSDYAGIDVRGKVVAMFGGAPAHFSSAPFAHYSKREVKLAEASRRGAIGRILLPRRKDSERYAWPEYFNGRDRRVQLSWRNSAGEIQEHFPNILADAYLPAIAAHELFAGSPLSFEEALDSSENDATVPTRLGVEVSIRSVTRHRPAASSNVIGIVRGSDPVLANEYVVLTAHLDHLGTDRGLQDDQIFNGFYDNAVGVATIVEVARLIAGLPEAPSRSLAFVAVTGEESNLIGSDFFAEYGPIDSGKLVANINIDMPLFTSEMTSIVALGASHSSLGSVVESVASASGLHVEADVLPDRALFGRSDHYSFVRRGVPALYLAPGTSDGASGSTSEETLLAFIGGNYHKTSDDSTQPVDWSSAQRFAQIVADAAVQIATDRGRPTWNEGDFFGDRFSREN